MTPLRLVPVVEGHGEERAVPVLLRRWLRYRNLQRSFQVPELAINAKGAGRLKAAFDRDRHRGIECWVSKALIARPDAIVVILDADDECQRRGKGQGLGPELLERARRIARDVPIAVVIAHREFEAWFLANLDALRAAGLIGSLRLPAPQEPERPRNCKKSIEQLLGCSYEETVHQVKFAERLSFSAAAQRRSPSYAKLLKDLEHITRAARQRARQRRSP